VRKREEEWLFVVCMYGIYVWHLKDGVNVYTRGWSEEIKCCHLYEEKGRSALGEDRDNTLVK
jgi:hypothetical protein